MFDTRVVFTEAQLAHVGCHRRLVSFKGNITGNNVVYNCQSSNDSCPTQFPNQVLNKPVYAIHGGVTGSIRT